MKPINVYKVVTEYYDKEKDVIMVYKKSNLISIIEKHKALNAHMIYIYRAIAADNGNIFKFILTETIFNQYRTGGELNG